MATFITHSYGFITRRSFTNGDLPSLTVSEDPWIDVTSLLSNPVVGDHYVDGEVVTDHTSLTAAKGNKLAELRDAAASHIKLRGVGVPYSATDIRMYGTTTHDQANVHSSFSAALALEATDPDHLFSVWCGDVTGQDNPSVDTAVDWAIRDHSIADVKHLARNLSVHIVGAQEELQSETAAVLAATTVAAVNAITWQQPGA